MQMTATSEAPSAPSQRVRASSPYGDEMVKLYRVILQALPDANCRVIEVIAAHPDEGVSTVVRMLAESAAWVANARVLICDATAKRDNFKYFAVPSTSMNCLSEVPPDKIDLRQVIEELPSAGLSLSAVAKLGMESEIAVNVDRLDPVFAALRREFDLILIDAGAISQGALGLALAKKADRVVLVIEAERTRTPVVAAARQAIEVNGGHLLGVVLNKRRFHIPRFVYRWL
jgi:protein-tyrosine kinase